MAAVNVLFVANAPDRATLSTLKVAEFEMAGREFIQKLISNGLFSKQLYPIRIRSSHYKSEISVVIEMHFD